MNKEIQEKYNIWNGNKKSLQDSDKYKKIYFKEGDIWWVSLGFNIGTESFGKGKYFRRPVLIVKKLSGDFCIALPITSKEKKGTWFINITKQGKQKWVMLHQIRAIHKKRFQRKIGELDKTDFFRVKEKLERLLK